MRSATLTRMILFSGFLICAFAFLAFASLSAKASQSNCIQSKCIGPVFIFVEDANEADYEALSKISKDVVNIEINGTDLESIYSDVNLSNHNNLIVFVNDISSIEDIHPEIDIPADIPIETTQILGSLQSSQRTDPSTSWFIIFDKNRTGCGTYRCILDFSMQFLENTHDVEILISKEK